MLQLKQFTTQEVWQKIATYFYDQAATDVAAFAAYKAQLSDWEKIGDFAKNTDDALFPRTPTAPNYLYIGKLAVGNQIILKVKNIIPHSQIKVTFLFQAEGLPFAINTFATPIILNEQSKQLTVDNLEKQLVFKKDHSADNADIIISGTDYQLLGEQAKYQIFGVRNFILEINVCHSSCLECKKGDSSLRSCTKCQPSFTFIQITSTPIILGRCICRSDQFMISNNPCPASPCSSCSACHQNCLTCFTSGSQGCLSCKSDQYFYNNQCFIQCQTGTYQDEVNKTCVDCYPSCQECFGPGNQQCKSCKQTGGTTKYLDGNQCVDTCPTGKFINGTNKTCDLCDPTCYQCDSSSPDNCTDCSGSYFYHETGTKKNCLKKCPDKKFANSVNRKCDDCSPDCGNCQGPLSTDCISCGAGVPGGKNYLSGTTCVDASSCGTGTFADVSFICKLCNPECKECSGDKNDQCKQCDITKNRFLEDGKKCVTSCKAGYFQDKDLADPKCTQCVSSCLSCTGGTPQDCTKCQPSFYMQKKTSTDINGECKATCDPKYYPDSKDFMCKDCSVDCENCSGPKKTDCIGCTGSTFLTITKECVTTCPEGYFGESNICKVCDTTCKTCVDTLTKCLSCNGTKFLDNNLCVDTCPPDKYTSPIDKKCYKCAANCLTCEGSNDNECVTCQPTTKYFAKNDSDKKGKCTDNCNSLGLKSFEDASNAFLCVKDCPQYYFTNVLGSVPVCERCHSSCLECANNQSNGCTKCYEPFYYFSGQCGQCPNGKFGEVDSSGHRICTDCSNKCKLCKGKTDKDCTSCGLNEFLNEGQCGSCPLGTFGYSNNCVKNCPLGMFGQNYPIRVCKECAQSCDTCFDKSSENCTSCKTNFYLFETKCLSECVDGTWKKPVSTETSEPVCSPCDTSCYTCGGPLSTDCKTCRDGRFLYNNSECVLQCPDIYYGQKKGGLNNCITDCEPDQWKDIIEKQCKQCAQECTRCTGPTFKFCLECAPGFIRFKDMCLKECPDGYWMNNIKKTCEACSDQCQKCEQNEEHKCLKCSKKYFLLEGKCVDKCPELLQPNKELQICQACPNKTYTLYDSVRKQLQCIDCHYSCSKCNGPLQDQCLVCEPTRGEQGLVPLKGYCFCHSNLVDKLEVTCYEKDSLDEFATGSQTLSFFTSTIIAGFIGLFGNPTVLFSFIEISQQLSYMTYLNTTYPMDYDAFSKRFYGYNVNSLLLNPLSEIDLGGAPTQAQQNANTNGRTLQGITVNNDVIVDQQNQSNNAYLKGQKANDKYYFNDRTSSFLYNSFTLLLISVFFWLIALTFRFVRYVYRKVNYKNPQDALKQKKKQFTMGNKISALLTVGLPFIIFQITSLEFMLYSLLQYRDMDDSTLFNFISFSICVVGSVYFLLMIYYIYYVLNIVKKHRKQNYYSKWSFLWSQVNFQKSKTRRNFFLLLILKKFFICVLLVFLQVRLEFQMLGIFLLSALTLGYMLFLNPYQERFYRYVSVIAYTLVMAIHCCVLIYSLTNDINHQVKCIGAAKVLTGILMLFYCAVCIIELVRNIPIIFKILKKIFAYSKEEKIHAEQLSKLKKVHLKEDEKGLKNDLNENSVVNPLENSVHVGSNEEVEEELGPKHLKYSSDEDSDNDDDDDDSNENNSDKENEETDYKKKKLQSQDIPLTQFMLSNKKSLPLSRSGSVTSEMQKSRIQQTPSQGNIGQQPNQPNNYSIKFRLPRAESQLEYQISNQKFSEIQKYQNNQGNKQDKTVPYLQPEIISDSSKKKIKLKGIKQGGNLMNSLKILQQSDGFIRNAYQSQKQQQNQSSLPQSPLKKPPKVNEKKTKIQNLLKGMNFDSPDQKKPQNEFDTPYY